MLWFWGRRGLEIPLPPRRIEAGHELRRAGARLQIQSLGGVLHGELHDRAYVSVRYEDADRLAHWLGEIQEAMTLAGFGYRKSISDCDDTAATAVAMRRMLPFELSPLAVRQEVDLVTGGRHMDTAWLTDHGWICIEPQSGEWWDREDYPHRRLKVFVQ